MDRETHLVLPMFSGFGQRHDRDTSGFLRLEENVHKIVCDSEQRRKARYEIHSWKSDVSEIVGRHWKQRPGYTTQYWIIAGYSYGGNNAVRCCWELYRRNDRTEVAELHLCDPVVRWSLFPGLAAITGMGKLKIPPNVKKVVWVRQRNPRWEIGRSNGLWFQPAGHDVVAVDSDKTEIETPVISEQQHDFVDSNSDFHDRYLATVKEYLGRIPA